MILSVSSSSPAWRSVSVAEERVRHDLRDAEPQQDLADLTAALLSDGQVTVERRCRHPLADPVVALVAGHLLDDVDLAVTVGPPRRQRHGARVTARR